ncbi:MAG: hypothetical protein WCI67_00425 [Chloroflexales bacterium]
MATPKTPVPGTSQAGLSASSIADAGAGLTRLLIATITLPLTAANTFGTVFARLISSMTAALDGAAAPNSNNEIVKATTDLVNATTGLYVSLIKVTVSSLDSAVRAINTAVESSTTTRK